MCAVLGVFFMMAAVAAGGQTADGNAGGAGGAGSPGAGGASSPGAGGAGSPGGGGDTEEYLAFDLQAQLLVADRQAAADRLVSWTEEGGGYFVERATGRVVLRVPADSFDELRKVAAGAAEQVVSYYPRAEDVRDELRAVRATIESREQSLEELLTFLEQADVTGTLALEREIDSLMREIESYKGRRRFLQTRVAFARAEIALSAQSADIPTKRPSSFAWLNSLDLYRFIEEAGR
jgi:hypothetical protein